MMNLRHIEVFAVYQAGSVNGAAEGMEIVLV